MAVGISSLGMLNHLAVTTCGSNYNFLNGLRIISHGYINLSAIANFTFQTMKTYITENKFIVSAFYFQNKPAIEIGHRSAHHPVAGIHFGHIHADKWFAIELCGYFTLHYEFASCPLRPCGNN